jgi:hypothetical protein
VKYVVDEDEISATSPFTVGDKIQRLKNPIPYYNQPLWR